MGTRISRIIAPAKSGFRHVGTLVHCGAKFPIRRFKCLRDESQDPLGLKSQFKCSEYIETAARSDLALWWQDLP